MAVAEDDAENLDVLMTLEVHRSGRDSRPENLVVYDLFRDLWRYTDTDMAAVSASAHLASLNPSTTSTTPPFRRLYCGRVV
jgi:hypothetical protein